VRYPNALWRGASRADYSTTRIEPRLVVIHVAQGSATGTTAWFHNPAAEVSAHFLSPKSGPMLQFVDTNEEAYAECAFNGLAISVEHEGFSGEHLNKNQLANDAALFKWLRTVHRIPVEWRSSPYGRPGYCSHSELGLVGGDHPGCPGPPIVADVITLLATLQRHPVIKLAR